MAASNNPDNRVFVFHTTLPCQRIHELTQGGDSSDDVSTGQVRRYGRARGAVSTAY